MINKITIPKELDDIMSTVVGKHIVFVELYHDQDASDPCETAGMGHIWSFCRRHSNYLRDFEFPANKSECEPALRKRFGNDLVILGYFEHGNSIWHIAGEPPAGTSGDYRWDGVSFAGVWVPDKTVLDAAKTNSMLRPGTKKRQRWMHDQADACCRVYTSWCNGDVYAYRILAYAQRTHPDGEHKFDDLDDYRFDTEVYEDACSGYYGYEAAIEAVRSAAADCENKLKELTE